MDARRIEPPERVEEMGGMRVEFSDRELEMIIVAISSFVYRLRSAESLLAEETLLLTSAERTYIWHLIRDLREAAEDGTTELQKALLQPRQRSEAEARLGEEQF